MALEGRLDKLLFRKSEKECNQNILKEKEIENYGYDR